jgi:hypothetical protein
MGCFAREERKSEYLAMFGIVNRKYCRSSMSIDVFGDTVGAARLLVVPGRPTRINLVEQKFGLGEMDTVRTDGILVEGLD